MGLPAISVTEPMSAMANYGLLQSADANPPPDSYANLPRRFDADCGGKLLR